MLRELLRLVETAEGPISLSALARQLGVDAAVLDGMLQHWVRKGRLVVEGVQGRKGAGGQGRTMTL
jgi:predicted ArsR family transcriptional regulator